MSKKNIADFGELLPKELELLASCGNSRKLTSSVLPEEATQENKVRAEFLRFLLLDGGHGGVHIHESGIHLSGAWIEGQLNLECARIPYSFTFSECQFAKSPNLTDACISGKVTFFACKMPSVLASRIDISGEISLKNSVLQGRLVVVGARIGGDLNCSGVSLNPEEGSAFRGNGMTVGGNVLVNGMFTANGKIELADAEIQGNFFADNAVVTASGIAFISDRFTVAGSVFFREAQISGECRLLGAHVTGTVSFLDAKIENPAESALLLDRVLVGGELVLSKMSVQGRIRLPGAQVTGSLTFSASKISSPAQRVLVLERASVGGDVTFNRGFTAEGEVCLNGMTVNGNFHCTGSLFENDKGDVITAEGMVVAKAFTLRKMTKPVRNFNLSSTQVGRLVDDENSWGNGLVLNGFTYKSFAGTAPTSSLARLRWLDKQRPSHAGHSRDVRSFRPQPWRQLRGVLREMGHFEDARQIAIAYENRLRHVGVIGQASNGKSHALGRVRQITARFAHWSFGVLIGYGYRPVRLLGWLLCVWLISGILYWYAALQGVMAPSNPLVFQNEKYEVCASAVTANENGKNKSTQTAVLKGNWYLCDALPEEYTGFSPLTYSLDALLPFVDLHQEKDWGPRTPTPQSSWTQELSGFSLKHIVRLTLWFEILFGWIASLLLVAVVSGLTKRAED